MCIDEVHQFVMFSTTFGPEFGLLRESLFNLIMDKNNNATIGGDLSARLKIPLLAMTATFNEPLLNIFEKRIGIKVLPQNHLWSGRNAMQRRTVKWV